MVKVLIKQDDVMFINTYAPNIGTPKYWKQILTSLKGEINNTMVLEKLDIHMSNI